MQDRFLRVLLIAPYPLRTAPSQRFRFEQYLHPLQQEKIWIDVYPLLDRKTAKLLYKPGFICQKVSVVLRGAFARIQNLLQSKAYDLVFIHREAYPLGYPWFERILALQNIPYIFDFDDAIYLWNVSEANRFIAPLKYAQKTQQIVRWSSLTIAGNEFLADWAQQFSPNISIIPTTIDTNHYTFTPFEDKEELCVGWSGSVTTIAHLAPLSSLLREIQREHQIKIRIIGDPSFQIEDATVETLPWQEKTELQDLRKIDIGLMPLPDENWARGKCGLKALQYMALGIPTIMSPVGVNTKIAEGNSALLASSENEWKQAIESLLLDKSLRKSLGKNGRKRVEEEYSVQANLGRYVDAIRRVAKPIRS